MKRIFKDAGGTTTVEWDLHPATGFTRFRVEGQCRQELVTLVKQALLQQARGDMALELREWQGINSMVVGMVLLLHREVVGKGGKFVLIAPPPKLLELLRRTSPQPSITRWEQL